MTANYWVMDASGGVLGPVSLPVLRDLAAARRISDFTKASRDGKTWVNVHEIRELFEAITPPSMGQRREQELQEAQRIALQLDRFREMSTHELFGVPKTSDLRTYRQGFLTVAKPFHPGRLANNVHAELVKAYMEMFQFLSGRMADHEKRERSKQIVAEREQAA